VTQPASTDQRGLLDTSVFIAKDSDRPLGPLPDAAAISVITLAELHLGVLMADDPTIRAQRLRTMSAVRSLFEPVPIDTGIAEVFAELIAEARRSGRRPNIMNTWIAATAVALELPIYTQDDDFRGIPRVEVHRV